MYNQTDLAADTVYQKANKELTSFGFHQREKIGDLFPTVYCMLKDPQYRQYHPYLKISWNWFLVASSIWKAEFIPITAHLVELIKKRAPLPPVIILIFMFAKKLPSKSIQQMAKIRQSMAHNGEYEDLLKNNDRFIAHSEAVLSDPKLRKGWELMQAVFDMSQFTNDVGVVRRYMVGERGYRLDWKFDPNDPESLVRTLITLLSADHDLYGFQNGQPLVVKFSANLTAFGTVMMAPKYQSDFSSDMNRKTMGKFPRAYGAAFKGAKAIVAKRQREDEAMRTYMAALDADEHGLVGKERLLYIIEQAGLPPLTDDRKIRSLIALGKKLLGV